jgi:hypothetical protein
MGGYWQTAFRRAWGDTKGAFKFNQQTAGLALIAVASWVPMGIFVGLPAVRENLVSYFGYVAPLCLAVAVLFAWNFIRAQGRMYAEVASELAALKIQISTPDLSVGSERS